MGEIRIKRDVSDAIVYGIHIDPNIQDPSNAVTYLEDAVGMTPASMGSTSFNAGSWADAFFMPKPCMVRYDGTVDYYLDPSDYSKKADGTVSDIADPNYGGNAMIEWGLIWFKFEPGEADGEGYFYVSNKKVNDSFNCWCNYDADNNITQHFYTAIYNGTGIDKLRSLSGVQLTPANGSGNTTGQQEITRAMANNTSELTEWYIDLWADRILVTGLLYLMGKSLNLQATFGRGLDSGGQTAKESYVTGTLNDKGLFWGTTANGNSAVKVFGMENRWGGYAHRTAGLFGTAGGYAYKLTHGNIDGSTAISFGTNASGYIPVTVARPNDGYVTKMMFGKHGLLPSAVDGSPSTYYSDYFYSGTGFSRVGGSSSGSYGCGFSINLSSDVSSGSPAISTSLSLKPRAKIPYNPDWDNRPAHQFVNGQWVDIPTHHYTNGRWRGELTSQSPLKFRADGEMLDWRIEGKTSGNLWDGTIYNLSPANYPQFAIDENGYMYSTPTSPDYRGWTYQYSQIRTTLSAGTYTFAFTGIAPTLNGAACNIRKSDDTSLSDINGLRNRNTWVANFTLTETTDIGVVAKILDGKYHVQLLEGTYTAENIPEYEPYGGVGDWDETTQRYKIPVRVEGENLFDINGEHTSLVWDGKECLVIENDAIIVNQIRPGYMTGIYYDEVYKPGTYTFAMKQLAAQSDKTEIRVVSSAPFAGGAYNDAYKAYTAALVKHDDTHYITIVVTEPTEIGFFINGYFSVNDKIYDIQLLEGTYIASTIPPYEVNLFTDHQLMEGDSIDYTTNQTAIPIATGNNVLTVDTAVKPSKVFVKFEG